MLMILTSGYNILPPPTPHDLSIFIVYIHDNLHLTLYNGKTQQVRDIPTMHRQTQLPPHPWNAPTLRLYPIRKTMS